MTSLWFEVFFSLFVWVRFFRGFRFDVEGVILGYELVFGRGIV